MDQVQPVNPTSNKIKPKKEDQQNQPHHTMAPTFDIPFGRSKTSAKRTSPARPGVRMGSKDQIVGGKLTLPHEIFEMMPFDIVSQIADVDTTVLLGRLAHGLHHLLFSSSTIFERSRRSSTSAVARP